MSETMCHYTPTDKMNRTTPSCNPPSITLASLSRTSWPTRQTPSSQASCQPTLPSLQLPSSSHTQSASRMRSLYGSTVLKQSIARLVWLVLSMRMSPHPIQIQACTNVLAALLLATRPCKPSSHSPLKLPRTSALARPPDQARLATLLLHHQQVAVPDLTLAQAQAQPVPRAQAVLPAAA